MKKQLLLVLLAFAAAPAHAHFLWAQTDTNSQQLRLYFGEGGEGVSTDVKADILAKARAWKPTGEALPTQLSGGAFCASLDNQTPVYGAHQSWGVLDRSESGRGVFRLEYFAKAATTLDKAGFSAKLPFEFFARSQGNEALVTLKRGAQLVANSEVTIVTPDNEKGTKVLTNAQGQLRFPVSTAGLYALRAVVIDKAPGKLDGKAYPQTRTWTTLTFHTGQAAKLKQVAAVTTEPAMGNPAADPRAYSLLKAAHDNRQVVPASFVGFEADLVYTDGDKTEVGSIVYRRAGETKIQLDGLSKDDNAWLEDKVMNIIGHRRGGDFAAGDGRNPLSWVEGDNNDFGQLIRLNDRMKSEYRVKDNQVTEVTRTAGNTKFTITVLDTLNADAGKYLANHFMVSYRDATTNALQMVEGYRDTYSQIDGAWLPTSRVVYELNDKVTPRVRTFRFRDIKVMAPTTVATNVER